jgi:hypothetical protein
MSANNNPASSTLSRDAILRALAALSDELGKQGITGEICLFGGAVMVLAFMEGLFDEDEADAP